MIAYVDASVLLRLALGQPNALPEWHKIERGVSSALIATESLRTLDRLRIRAALPIPKSQYAALRFSTSSPRWS
jgi:predicted nucleic acid-binding protein